MGRLTGKGGASPNFFYMPHCYNGRVSSIVVSGTPIRRPWGYLQGPNDSVVFSKSQRFDYETELGFFISGKVPMGEIVSADNAREHIFGFVVLNDWSARDIQFYESAPLGPFNGKSAGTSISTWVVTLEALDEVGALVKVEDDASRVSAAPLVRCKDTVSIQVSTTLSREYSFPLVINNRNTYRVA
jgi:fumarylacetoacetase